MRTRKKWSGRCLTYLTGGYGPGIYEEVDSLHIVHTHDVLLLGVTYTCTCILHIMVAPFITIYDLLFDISIANSKASLI